MKTITDNKKLSSNTNICAVVRVYDETWNYNEMRYDSVSQEAMPEDDLKALVSGEVICVKLMPDVEAFYFEKPEDWPEKWSELGKYTRK
jgi:hypothetical protein